MEGLQEIKKRLYKFDKGRQSKLLEKWASKLKLQQIILENSEKVQWIFINSFNWSAITQINNNHWRQTKIKSHKRFLCKCASVGEILAAKLGPQPPTPKSLIYSVTPCVSQVIPDASSFKKAFTSSVKLGKS